MRLKIQAVCDRGRVRENNEDMASVGGILLRDNATDLTLDVDDDGYFYLFVADGMGGHDKGDHASRYLQEHLRECFTLRDFLPESFSEDIRNNVRYVSDKLNFRAAADRQERPMGSTLTGVVWFHGRIYLVNAGDSRTYRWRSGVLRQLTVDETLRGATGNPDADRRLLNCVGGGSRGNLSVEDITDRVMDGDIFLLCSDGLTEMVDDDCISEILATEPEPASALVERANDEGGADNISVIVALIGSGDFAPGPYPEDGYPDDDGRFDAWA